MKIHGVEEEDELPDAIQDIDFGGADGALDEAFDSVAKLHKVFTTAMPQADAKALLTVAEDTIKQLGEM